MRSTRPSQKTGPPALVRAAFAEHLEVVEQLQSQLDVIVEIAGAIGRALGAGHKVLIFGNGGSAADAQHMAAEFVGRYEEDRVGLPAIALTGNGSTVTAIGNDLGYAEIFARQIEALGRPGDVAVGITTSGKSENVLRALKAAKSAGLVTIALTGRTGLAIGDVDVQLRVPSTRTARIQEAHITAIHCICELIEQECGR
jgi:D-sedoheptulose 7-phosphate isomerase